LNVVFKPAHRTTNSIDIGALVYGYAMQKIGSSKAATVGALVPDKQPFAMAIAGLSITICGVVLASEFASY